MHHLVVDCPDPAALASFYSALLGLPVTYRSPDFAVVSRDSTTSGVAFQRADDYQAPDWPDPRRPQHMHLDVMVDDVETAARQAVAIGARGLDTGRNVFADPAGHPFCLIPRPAWAPPIGGPASPGARSPHGNGGTDH